MAADDKAKRLFRMGFIARSIQRAHLEKMASRLGVEEHVVVRDYGMPDLPLVPESFVYLIGYSDSPPDGEPVKIGYTRDLPNRIETLKPGSVQPLCVIAVQEGGLEREREIHERHAKRRIRADWFEMCDGIRADFGLRVEAAA
jgi:hypothetical protein